MKRLTLVLVLMMFAVPVVMAQDELIDFDSDLLYVPESPSSTDSASDNMVPGDGIPLLEIDGKAGIFKDGSLLYLTYRNEKKLLGALKRSGLRITYTFTKEWPTRKNNQEVLASVSPSVSGLHFKVFSGDRDEEIGRVYQKFFSWGTGLNVYQYDNKEKTRVGYVDEKAAQTIRSWGTKRPYAFQKVTVEEKEVKKLFGGTKTVEEEVKTDMFWFVDKDFGNIGPAGVFMTNEKVPFLAVKGDWWMSEHIFDLFTTRAEAEGAPGKILRGIGQLLAESPEEAERLREDEDDVVLNPTAYLGVFLTGIVYVPEFRQAVGLDISIPEP